MRCSKQRSLKTEQAQPRRKRDALGGSGCRIWGNSHIVHGNDINTQMNWCNHIYRYVRMNAVSIQMYVLVLSRSSALTIQHVHIEEHGASNHSCKASLTFQCLSCPERSSRFGCHSCAYCYILYFRTQKQRRTVWRAAWAQHFYRRWWDRRCTGRARERGGGAAEGV
jgi:hypothetical protein